MQLRPRHFGGLSVGFAALVAGVVFGLASYRGAELVFSALLATGVGAYTLVASSYIGFPLWRHARRGPWVLGVFWGFSGALAAALGLLFR